LNQNIDAKTGPLQSAEFPHATDQRTAQPQKSIPAQPTISAKRYLAA
jgi:hypothetical protein